MNTQNIKAMVATARQPSKL